MDDLTEREKQIVHFISACHKGQGNRTICGVPFHYPVRGNGWRVEDVTCPECNRIIVDCLHNNFDAIERGEYKDANSDPKAP